MSDLELVIRCKKCDEFVDVWDLDPADPATHLCEIARDIDFTHTCPEK